MAISEGNRLNDALLWELAPEYWYSRKKVTVASGANVVTAGTVMGKITSGGKWVPYDNGASDGSQAAAGLLVATVDATSADVTAVVIYRTAILKTNGLTWKSGQSAGDKTAGIADLVALGIDVRDDA